MSLETLLEAARYLEYRSEVKARGEEPHDYYTYSKLSSINNNSSSSNVSSVSSSSSSHSHKHLQTNNSPSHSGEEAKEKRRSGSSTSRESFNSQEHMGGTREVHNKLEKNRRAHLKECFEALKKQLPNMDERKTSNLSVLRGALRYIQILKRKEREYEHDLEKLARDKIAFQQQLSTLKKEVSSQYDHIDVNALMSVEDNETTTTASECGGVSDFEDDFQQETSPISNTDSRLASDDTTSLSSSNAAIVPSKSVNTSAASGASPTASAVPKQTSASTVFPVGLKASLGKSSSFAPDAGPPVTPKNVPHGSASEAQNIHAETASDIINSQHTRLMPTSSLQTMAGIISSPHAVQVITPPSNIKLLSASNSGSASSSTTIHPFQMSHHHHQQQHSQQIHVLASPNLPYVASPVTSAVSKLVTPEPLVHISDPLNSKQQQTVSPIALVSSQAFVNVSQVVTTSKPVVVNQTSNIAELITSGASSSLANQVLMKTPMSSPVLGSNLALTVKNSSINHNITDASTSNLQQSIFNSVNATKSSQQIIQPSSIPHTVSTLISSDGLQHNTGFQASASSKSHSISSSTALLSHSSNMSHLVSQSPISVPANHLVAASNHIPGIAPLVGSVSVVSHTGALHHHQILTQPQPLGKVIASPILKSINQIPIIQQQFLQATGSMSNQHIVKPVVVVSVPNIIHSGNLSSMTSRHVLPTGIQSETACTNSPRSQK